MCNQDKIDMVEPGDFVLASIVNRVRQPGINKQDVTAGRNNFESRLAVPGELRFHAPQQTEKIWPSKSNDNDDQACTCALSKE